MQAKIKVAARAEEAGHRMKVLRYMCVLYLTTCVSHYYKAAARAEEAGHRLQVHLYVCPLLQLYVCPLLYRYSYMFVLYYMCVLLLHMYYYMCVLCSTIYVSSTPILPVLILSCPLEAAVFFFFGAASRGSVL